MGKNNSQQTIKYKTVGMDGLSKIIRTNCNKNKCLSNVTSICTLMLRKF